MPSVASKVRVNLITQKLFVRTFWPPLSSVYSTLQVLHDQIVQFTDAGAATGNAVVTFEKDSLSLLAPRGRFDVEMYLSSLKLTGQVRCMHISFTPVRPYALLASSAALVC